MRGNLGFCVFVVWFVHTCSATCTAGGGQPAYFVAGSGDYSRLTCNDGAGGLNNGFVWGQLSTDRASAWSGPPPMSIFVCANQFDTVCTGSMSTLNSPGDLVEGNIYRFRTWQNDFIQGVKEIGMLQVGRTRQSSFLVICNLILISLSSKI